METSDGCGGGVVVFSIVVPLVESVEFDSRILKLFAWGYKSKACKQISEN